jgi:hypothetical protein
MTQEEINNYNRLCAEFLGFKYKNQAKFWAIYPLDNSSYLRKLGYVRMDKLEFHSDWNWIMEVVEKIKYIEDNQEKFFGEEYYLIHFEIDLLNGVDLFIDKKRLFSQSAFGEGQLKEAVVKAINQFLIWYNNEQRT